MSLNINNNKELQKKQNTITFINAATEMIAELGIEHISIRKIAEKPDSTTQPFIFILKTWMNFCSSLP